MAFNNTKAMVQQPKFSAMVGSTAYQKMISTTFSDPKRQTRFVAAITSAVANNPALQDCNPASILAAAMLGEGMNLGHSPQLGHYYMVPFKVKTGRKDQQGNPLYENKVNFILGYKGYIQLAMRSGAYTDLDVMEIHAGEYLGKDQYTGKPKFQFIENDDEREAAPVVGYMAYFEYNNGFRKVLYWSKEKMMAHADKYSPAFSRVAYERLMKGEIPQNEMWKYSSFWYKDFDSMAKKTMLRQLISKWGMMSTEMMTGLVNDGATADVIRDDHQNLTVSYEPHNEEPDALASAPAPAEIPAAAESVPEPAPVSAPVEELAQVSLDDL